MLHLVWGGTSMIYFLCGKLQLGATLDVGVATLNCHWVKVDHIVLTRHDHPVQVSSSQLRHKPFQALNLFNSVRQYTTEIAVCLPADLSIQDAKRLELETKLGTHLKRCAGRQIYHPVCSVNEINSQLNLCSVIKRASLLVFVVSNWVELSTCRFSRATDTLCVLDVIAEIAWPRKSAQMSPGLPHQQIFSAERSSTNLVFHLLVLQVKGQEFKF
ncbi:hypothetical protein J6590_044213 [Homalodisca vitripennis]|nr:hypothetical protein J6590_044213 [Homalodisca vitripennis]